MLAPLVTTTEWLGQDLDNQQVRIVEVSVNPGLWVSLTMLIF
ncbi:hypothetical protein [Acidovorax sp. 69]|nr:hypothetical protein [Acidovorax sp. 69]